MQFGYTLLYVPDPVAAAEFYEAAFAQKRRFVHEGGYVEMETGATALGFVSLELARSAGGEFATCALDSPAPPVEVAFVTEQLDDAYRRAVAAGAVAVSPPKEKPWGQSVAYVRDLNGFLVELCTPVKGS